MKAFPLALLLSVASAPQALPQPQLEREVFVTEQLQDIPYRIPAIACTPAGSLVAVADYRFCRQDIGFPGTDNGRIDLRASVSVDGGATWSAPATVVRGLGKEGNGFDNGFGDPCIVADRATGEILLMSCAGDITYTGGSRQHHQAIATMRSTDEGRTWTAPVDIAPQVYALFDQSPNGPARAMFIGSGKIHQSRHIRVGSHYRLYCANLLTNVRGEWVNHVLYSDDFGRTWQVLGDVGTEPVKKADEPKVEELPDGRVLLSSRCGGGRQFNIFTFSDTKAGKGHWAEAAFSGEANQGTVARGNSCNGEIQILPAVRVADGKRLHLALQSVPLGPGRTNVGIHYKELESPASYATPQAFASDWTGTYACTKLPSAYSTMTLMPHHTIAFLFEEETHCTSAGGGYTIKFQRLSLEEITGGKYRGELKN